MWRVKKILLDDPDGDHSEMVWHVSGCWQDVPVTRVAAVDCGTNSIRLLVADIVDGRLGDVVRRTEVVRLGEGVDQTGRLAPEALARTLAMTNEYAETCRDLGVSAVRFVATSATRDASNRDEFVAGVKAAFGVEPEVVTGDGEARLSFAGAISVVGDDHPAPYLVVDLGGGSTELVLGSAEPDAAWSMDIGSVRLTERYLRSDPPTPDEIAEARIAIDAALDEALAAVPVGKTATLVGVAGSVTSVTAHALCLDRYDHAMVDGAVLSVEQLDTACADLLGRSREQRLALGFMHPGRADVIGAGALIWASVIDRVVCEVRAAGGDLRDVVTSEHDILDGIALSLGR